MVKDFQKYIADEGLFSEKEKVLIATSGGIDSISLCHLFQLSAYNFGIAHCNFQLRDNDSDQDEIFVRDLAAQFQVPFYAIQFETERIAKERKESIQVVARDLRYDWLEKIRKEKNYHRIATAHHLNDSIETVLYNFTKGCGIRGLHGILPLKNNIIRPLLFATKSQIESFAQKEKIEYREDASNATDKYSRNKIRHHVIPVLKELNPSIEKTISQNIERLKEVESLYKYAIEKLKKEVISSEPNLLGNDEADTPNQIKINIKKLISSPAPQTLLFEIILKYGFNNEHSKKIIETIENTESSSVGKQFNSDHFDLIIDRDFLILRKKENSKGVKYFIEKNQKNLIFEGNILKLKSEEKPPKIFPTDPNKVYLNEAKIKYPLVLRHWEKGDYFRPFGMAGKKKKLSDFFTDIKLNRFEKGKVWILESDHKICWIVGFRTDERFKIEADSDSCLAIEFILKNTSQ